MNIEYIFYKEFIIIKKNFNIKYYMVLNLCCCVNICIEIIINICNIILERKEVSKLNFYFLYQFYIYLYILEKYVCNNKDQKL